MPGHDSPQIHVSAKVANDMASDHEKHLIKHKKLALIVDLDRTVSFCVGCKLFCLIETVRLEAVCLNAVYYLFSICSHPNSVHFVS